MANAGGFRVDFDQFLRMGRIGPAADIQIAGDGAVWGDEVVITALCDGVAILTAHAQQREDVMLGRWPVNGERHLRWRCREPVVFRLVEGHDELARAVLQVRLPPAQLEVDSVRSCPRFEAQQFTVRLRYAQEAYIAIDGEDPTAVAIQAADQPTVVRIPWRTERCGRFTVRVHALGLDGGWQHAELTLDVVPRAVQSRITPLGDGGYDIDILNAAPVELHIPVLGIRQPLQSSGFRLTYHGLQPMLVNALMRDDAGNVTSVDLVLQEQFSWQPLPTLTQPLGWQL